MLAIVASYEDPTTFRVKPQKPHTTGYDIFGREHFAGLTPPQSVLSLSWCSAASPTSKQSRAVEYFRQVGNMPGPYLRQVICMLSPISSHIIMKYRNIEVSQYQNEMIQETTQNNPEIIGNIATFMVYACIYIYIYIYVKLDESISQFLRKCTQATWRVVWRSFRLCNSLKVTKPLLDVQVAVSQKPQVWRVIPSWETVGIIATSWLLLFYLDRFWRILVVELNRHTCSIIFLFPCILISFDVQSDFRI